MNLGEIRTRITNLYGNTLTSEETFLNQCINDAYQKLCIRADWWWLEREAVLTFEGIVLTQTGLTLTNGTTAMTISPSIGDAYDEGWAFTGEQTYRVSTAGSTTVLFDATFIDDTSTAQTMIFWNDIATLPTDTGEVLSLYCRNDPNHKPLQEVPIEYIEQRGPNVNDYKCEWGQMYAVFNDHDLSSALRLRIFPPPESTAQYTLRYRCVPADLSSDTDVPLIPVKHHQVLVDKAKVEVLKTTYEYPDVVQQIEMEAERGVMRMIGDRGRDNTIYRMGRRFAGPRAEAVPFKTVNTSLGI